jgi:predicted Kef-type K+ transport protein
MATDTKAWYKSKGIWTGIITVAVGAGTAICQLFGYDLNANAVFGLAISVLGALGLYSRATADTKIK